MSQKTGDFRRRVSAEYIETHGYFWVREEVIENLSNECTVMNLVLWQNILAYDVYRIVIYGNLFGVGYH